MPMESGLESLRQKREGVVLDENGMVTRITEANEECAALDADGLGTQALVATEESAEEDFALDGDGVGTQAPETIEECAELDTNGVETRTSMEADGVALDVIAMVTRGSEAKGEGAELQAGGVLSRGPEVEEDTTLYGHKASNESIGISKLNPLAMQYVPPPKFVSGSRAIQAVSSSTGNGHRNSRHQHPWKKPVSNGTGWAHHREDSIRIERIRRTIYVLDINQQLTEAQLVAIFISKGCGQVVDCRMWGYPDSPLGFAFVQFIDEDCALRALRLTGMMLDCCHPLTVLPSRTAIVPVIPRFLPQSKDEKEMCASTV